MEDQKKKKSKKFDPSRRDFIAVGVASVAGLAVGSIIGSQVFPKVETAEVAKDPCPYCDKEFDSETALGEHIKTAHQELIVKEVEVKRPQTIKLTVNGKQHELTIEPHTMLWDLLHDKLGYTSIREICLGKGACGSCTVT